MEIEIRATMPVTEQDGKRALRLSTIRTITPEHIHVTVWGTGHADYRLTVSGRRCDNSNRYLSEMPLQGELPEWLHPYLERARKARDRAVKTPADHQCECDAPWHFTPDMHAEDCPLYVYFGHIHNSDIPAPQSRVGTNTGHGHAWERPDGAKVRCGGPALCSMCRADEALTRA